jgi:hypothetical protein
MNASVYFEPIMIGEEESVNGGVVLAAGAAASASLANDVIAFSPLRGGRGPGGNFFGSAAKAAALAGLAGTFVVLSAGTLTASLNDSKRN